MPINTHLPDTSLATLLVPYQHQIEEKIKKCLHRLGDKNNLREACEYSLLNGGKRFRPALVLMVAKSIGKGLDASEAAMAIEFFHTASLVADDLPCMDNDDERRNKPALHKVYGEAMTLLVSYGLIAAGYECLSKNSQILRESNHPHSQFSDRICVLALENASYNTGLSGATGGQYLDIFPPNLEVATLREVIHKKTVTLFEIAFVLGWLFGGGELNKLDLLKKASTHFGMAFQIADDLGDIAQDAANDRKVNLAAVLGIEGALKMFHEEINQFLTLIQSLQVDSTELISLANLLIKKVEH